MTAAVILTEARCLVARGWCQGSFALDALDKPVSALDPAAMAFDLEGALMRVGADDQSAYRDAVYVVRDLAQRLGFTGLQHYNDHEGRTLAEVLALLDGAIEAATPQTVAA